MKKCQFCAEEILDEAIVCKHCGKELDKQAVKRKEYKWTLGKISCAVILVPMILVFVITLGRNSNNTNSDSSSTTQQKVSVGQEGFLRVGDKQDDVLLATSEKALDEIIKSSIAKDNVGIAQIVLDGRAIFVPYNTKVLVIDLSVGKRKVRILEGKNAGVTGWVPYEFIVAK